MITDGEAIRPGQLDLLDLAERGPRPLGHAPDKTVPDKGSLQKVSQIWSSFRRKELEKV